MEKDLAELITSLPSTSLEALKQQHSGAVMSIVIDQEIRLRQLQESVKRLETIYWNKIGE